MKTITTKPNEVKGDNFFTDKDWALFDLNKYVESKGIATKLCTECNLRNIPIFMTRCPHCEDRLQAQFSEICDAFDDMTNKYENVLDELDYQETLMGDSDWSERGLYDIA